MLMRLPAATVGLRPRGNERKCLSLRLAGLLSLGLHATLLSGLLLWFRHAPPSDAAAQTPGAVELVLLEQQGSIANNTPPEPAPSAGVPAPPPPQIMSPDLPPPDAVKADEALPLPPPPVPPPDAPPSVPRVPTPPVQRVQEAPEINIGGNDSETNAIVIAGPHVIPASIDAKYRNREPIYPREAARRAEQGAVILLIHVSPLGLPVGIDIAESSGFVLLDRAASEAVWGWHFLPAMLDGRPVPFDMKLRVVFQLD
jgi:protein TonB